jgi:hypothetical protein
MLFITNTLNFKMQRFFFSYAHFQNQYMPQSHYFFFDIRMLESLQEKCYTAK